MSAEASKATPAAAAAAKPVAAAAGDAKEVCRAFRNTGSCRFAGECKYVHSEGDPIEPPPRDFTPHGDCNNWKEKKECRFGERCRFLHGDADKRTTYRPERKKEEETGEQQVCRNFQRRGKCRFGDKCRHRHVPGEPKPKTEAKAKVKAAPKKAPAAKSEAKKSAAKKAPAAASAGGDEGKEGRKRRRRKTKPETKAGADKIVLTEDNKFDSQGVELCRNFRNNGKCRFGDDCTYSHEAGPAIGQPAGEARAPRAASSGGGGGGGRGDRSAPRVPGLCYNFRDEGSCEFGDECRFKHGDGDARDFATKPRARKSTGVCYQFQEQGSCEYGDECRFSHDAAE